MTEIILIMELTIFVIFGISASIMWIKSAKKLSNLCDALEDEIDSSKKGGVQE